MRTPGSSSPASHGGVFNGRKNNAFCTKPHISLSLCTQSEVNTHGAEKRAWLICSSSTKARRARSTHLHIYVMSCPSHKSFSVIQPPPPPVLISPTLLGFSLGLSRRFSEARRSLRSPRLSLHPHMLFCISGNLQHPRSWLGTVPQVVLFFNVLYLTQQENRLSSSRSAYTYPAPRHVFHNRRLLGRFPQDPTLTRSLRPHHLFFPLTSSLPRVVTGLGPLSGHPDYAKFHRLLF